MKTAKRKRVPTNENQEVDTIKQNTPATNTCDSLPSSKLNYYSNNNQVASSYYDDMNNHRLSSLAMPPPLAPPPVSASLSSNSQQFDYINYYQHMYASASAVAAVAHASATVTHQPYLNINQFFHCSKAPSIQTPEASKSSNSADDDKTGDELGNYYNYNYLNQNSSFTNISSSNKHLQSYLTLDNLNSSNIVAAKKSSYYCLTPASSTTSLNDLNNSKHLLEDFSSANSQINNTSTSNAKKREKKTAKQLLTAHQSLSTINFDQSGPIVQEKTISLSRTHSKKRTRLSIDTYKCTDIDSDTSSTSSLSTNSSTSSNKLSHTTSVSTFMPSTTNASGKGGRRGRGRPPKNTQTIFSETTLVSKDTITTEKTPLSLAESVPSNSSNILNSKEEIKPPEAEKTQPKSIINNNSTSVKSNKLIKSLINKSSSNSNLQKSKVLNTAAASAEITPTSSNVINNKKPQNDQQQITGYLVDKVNDTVYLNKQSQQQQNIHNSYYLNNISAKSGSSDTENNYIVCAKSSLYISSETSTNKQISYISLYNNDEALSATDEKSTPMLNLNWANGADLWKCMRVKEAKYVHDHLYLKRHLGIEPQMRSILLDWLVEISYAYRLHRETWHLALEYMDRFMTCCKQQMRVDRLQLIGMSCLFLAAKVEEIYPPKLKEFASHMENYSSNNEDALQQFELFILKTLNWEISPVTANTWLMTYLQIASINYYTNLTNYYNEQAENDVPKSKPKVHNSHMVMPLHIYKNSNSNLKDFKSLSQNNSQATVVQQQFYLNNYMKSVTLLDLCMFDMESLKYSYSVLAASAMYHMLYIKSPDQLNSSSQSNVHLNAYIVEKCTGYKLYELDSCIKWMYPYADVCKDILTEERMVSIKTFSNVDPDDAHNIQLYYQNLDLLKEAHSRKTPSKYYIGSSASSSSSHSQLLLTPPDSHRKYSSSSSISSDSILSTTSLMSTPATVNSTLASEQK